MNLQPYVTAVEDDVARSTALADESTREIAARVCSAIEPAVRLALVQALSDAAATITGQLDDTVVTVRMEGREPVVDVQSVLRSPGAEAGIEGEDDGRSARVTVRLPDTLKRRAETRAGEAEQSLNTWIVQAIRRASEGPAAPGHHPGIPHHSSRRITGWA